MHQGYIWHVAVGTFEAPDGELFERDIVRSPGAVGGRAAAVRRDGNPYVVLVRQYRAPFDATCSRSRRACATSPTSRPRSPPRASWSRRSGCSAGRLEHLTHFYPSAGMTDSVLHLFLATELHRRSQRDVHGPEEAHMEVLHLPLADAVDMVVRGEIHDAKTVIGLLLVDRRLREGSLCLGPDAGRDDDDAPAGGGGVPVVDGDRAGPFDEHA